MHSKLFSLLFVCFTLSGIAQNTIHSPYSSYGFGERSYGTDPISSALGMSSITYFDSTIVNMYNPASYNTLSQGQPLFSLGIRGRVSEFSQNGESYINGLGMVDHFAMAFTLKKHFGLAFGLKPYSRRGYELTENAKVGSDSLRYKYLGSGGANEAFIGLSSTIFKLKSSHLSIGGNLGYLFGTAKNERQSSIILNNSFFGGVDSKSVRFSSFHYELGAYFRQDFTSKQSLTLSAVVEPGQDIRAYRNESLYIAGNVNNPNTYAVLFDTSNVEGSLRLAPSYSVGFSYSLKTESTTKNNNTRNAEWLFNASYTSTDWTKYSSTFNGTEETYDYNATSKISVGFQFTPEYKFLENAVNTNFAGKLRYRLGYYQFNLPQTESGSAIGEFGTTFGIGMPIVAQQALSSINLGVTLGKRSNGEPQGLNERFIGINFGVIVAPSNYDRWFRKRKLD